MLQRVAELESPAIMASGGACRRSGCPGDVAGGFRGLRLELDFMNTRKQSSMQKVMFFHFWCLL